MRNLSGMSQVTYTEYIHKYKATRDWNFDHLVYKRSILWRHHNNEEYRTYLEYAQPYEISNWDSWSIFSPKLEECLDLHVYHDRSMF